MDRSNIRLLNYIIGTDDEEKVKLLLDYTNRGGEVADPWYTGDFEQTLQDITDGCTAILNEYKGD